MKLRVPLFPFLTTVTFIYFYIQCTLLHPRCHSLSSYYFILQISVPFRCAYTYDSTQLASSSLLCFSYIFRINTRCNLEEIQTSSPHSRIRSEIVQLRILKHSHRINLVL